MAYTASARSRSTLSVPATDHTGDTDSLDMPADTAFSGTSNTIARLLIDPDDAITGDPQTLVFDLTGAAIAVTAPYGFPAVDVLVKDRRDGDDNDFAALRLIHLWVIPKDETLDASGIGWITVGDPTEPDKFFHAPWELDYTAADPAADKSTPAALLVIPAGFIPDTGSPLTVAVKEGTSNENLRLIVNIAGD